MNQMDHCQQIKKLVENLVTSGNPTLNQEQLKALKKLCKSSDSNISELFQILIKYLKKQHAEIRLSTFQIIDEIFQKSHCFRELVLKRLKLIAELTIIYDMKMSPLKPVEVAKKLRTVAISSIHAWHGKFKNGYQSLQLGYKYLKECKNVDFEGLAVVTEQDRQRREDERRKEEERRQRKIEKIINEMNDKAPDISTLILEFNNAFKLLIPDLENFFIPLEVENESLLSEETSECQDENFEFGSNLMREHGLTKETTVQVNLSSIHNVIQTRDNEIILSTLNEKIKNIRKNTLPSVKGWEQSILPYANSQPDLLRKIIDLKASLESILKRFESLNVVTQKTKLPQSSNQVNDPDQSCSSDDDDFIDVPFDDPRVLQATASEALFEDATSSFKMTINARDLEAAGSSGVTAPSVVSSPSSKPKKDFDIDRLMQENVEEPFKFNNAFTDLHNKWLSNQDLHEDDRENVKKCDVLGVATRAVNFEREWKPVKWACRAPLLTGRLCQRKDREVCPLHGPIVPRDNSGKPVLPEDVRKERERLDKQERERPAWQDPTLLAEIRAATGVDLDMKKARKKRKYPNLTDVKAQENNPRNRLRKKVFSKSSIRRINKNLGKIPH